jgi:signal transduction histidine kinase
MDSGNHEPYPLLVEVSHQVNSPLAAIRNALYLAAQRTSDPEIIQYLAIADDEITSIICRIKSLRAEFEAAANSPPTIHTVVPSSSLVVPDAEAA